MRFKVLARSLADRRRLLVEDDAGRYAVLTLSSARPQREFVTAAQAKQVQFNRGWMVETRPAWRTLRELNNTPTYR
jgi:hypothetical protein